MYSAIIFFASAELCCVVFFFSISIKSIVIANLCVNNVILTKVPREVIYFSSESMAKGNNAQKKNVKKPKKNAKK